MKEALKLVLVEDDAVDAECVRRALQVRGIRNPLFVFPDGRSALNALRNRTGQPLEPPYLVLLDLNMPRMNGLEFLAELRSDADLRSTIVFVLTTSRDEKDVRDAYQANVAGYLVKSTGDGFGEVLSMLEQYSDLVEFPEWTRA